MMKRLLGILLSVSLVFTLIGCGKVKKKTLNIGVNSIGRNINPFLYTNDETKDLVKLSFIQLFPHDREGKVCYLSSENEGEVSTDGYTYYGMASLNSTEEEDGAYTYKIIVREDIFQANGDNITAKDLLFDYYVILDPSMKKILFPTEGNDDQWLSSWQYKFSTLPLVGYTEYLDGISEAYLETSETKREEKLLSTNISGINLISKTELQIKMKRKLSEEEVERLNIFVASANQFNDGSTFNYEYNAFGFKKGNISQATSAANVLNGGSGAFMITKIGTKSIKLKKNTAYFGGEPKVDFLNVILLENKVYDEDGKISGGGDAFYKINDGKVDLALIIDDALSENEMVRYNNNSRINGDVMSLFKISSSKYPSAKQSVYALVYSTKRFDPSSLSSLDLSDNYTYLDAIQFLNVKQSTFFM